MKKVEAPTYFNATYFKRRISFEVDFEMIEASLFFLFLKYQAEQKEFKATKKELIKQIDEDLESFGSGDFYISSTAREDLELYDWLNKRTVEGLIYKLLGVVRG